MKMRDILSEDVDMSFWADIDSKFNPEALTYNDLQRKRLELVQQNGGTAVFTKPVRDPQEPFSNKPKSDAAKSPGYRANINAQVKSGHISKEEGDKLIS